MPELSIIMPVYRSYPRMIECIDSILAQTFTDFELILIDDCTPDIESKNYCDEIAQKDNRIKVFHLDRNKGIAGARNFGLEQATGEFIHFSDADDHLESHMYEDMVKEIKESHTDMVITPYIHHNKRTEQKHAGYHPAARAYTKNDIWNLFIKTPRLMVWTTIYIKSIITKNNILFNEKVKTTDDIIFNHQYIQHVESMSTLENAYYTWFTYWSKSQGSNLKQTIESIELTMNSIYDTFHYFNAKSINDKKLFSSLFYLNSSTLIGSHTNNAFSHAYEIHRLKRKYNDLIIFPNRSNSLNTKEWLFGVFVWINCPILLAFLIGCNNFLKKNKARN